MNNLYDLVKRIDALTANSQQVLNALIRSCVASGSSSGYKVTKYGNEIVLTRSDIYRLYDFYQAWEAENFPADETSFYSILSAADTRWRKSAREDSALATDAVVKHSQILFMTADDASKTGEGNYNYWLERIRNSVSPKVTVSTAPIPLNLRTPLYDENLSVKSFSQYETYLFPIGYQRTELLGIPGDGESYLAGGKNWDIDVTENLTLTGKHLLLGKITNPDNRVTNYGDSINTLSWGNESYAFKDTSAAFGYQSVAVAPGAVVFGQRCRGFGTESFIGGGEELVTVGTRSFASNYNNYAIGNNSFVANRKNYTGGYPYRFEFITSTDITTVPCETIEIASEGKCVASSILQAQSMTASKKVMRIAGNSISLPGIPFEIQEGDTVAVYDHIYNGTVKGTSRSSYITGGVTACDLDGYASSVFTTTVEAIAPKYSIVNGVRTLTEVQITLAAPIPVENPLYNLTGGYMSRVNSQIRTMSPSLAINGTRRLRLGENSATFGYNNIASGDNQLIAGMNNTCNYEANFIVGTGTPGSTSYVSSSYVNTSYINTSSSYVSGRSNGLVVAPYYGYMKVNDGSSVIGVAGGTRTIPDEDHTNVYRGSFMYSRSSAYIRTGTSYVHGGTSYVMATPTNAVLETYLYNGQRGGMIAASAAPGVLVNPTYNVSTVVSSLQGTAVISAGSYLRSDGTRDNVANALLTRSSVIRNANDNGIGIYAQDGIDIRNTNNVLGRGINIETCSYLRLTFKELQLKGNTFGELTATDEARSFWLAQNGVGAGTSGEIVDIRYGNTTGHSGFYYGTRGGRFDMPFAPTPWEGQGLHVINSTVYNEKELTYHTASLTIPDLPNTDVYRSIMGTAYISSSYWRPMVTLSTYSGIGNSNDIGVARSYQLATYDDAVNSNVWSSAPMMRCGFSTISNVNSDSHIIGATSIDSTFMPVAIYTKSTFSQDNKWTVSDLYRAFPKSMKNIRTLGLDTEYMNLLSTTFTTTFAVTKQLTSSIWGGGGSMIHIGYTLNGNWLNMEMVIVGSDIYNFSVTGTNAYTGIRIPFFIGCSPVDHTSMPASSITLFELGALDDDAYSSSYRTLPGSVTTGAVKSSADIDYDYNNLHAIARVFTDGFMFVQLSSPVTGGTLPLSVRIIFSGIVPFIAEPACRSDYISTEWINRVRDRYGLNSVSTGRTYNSVERDMEAEN